jgi:hypothetical protein
VCVGVGRTPPIPSPLPKGAPVKLCCVCDTEPAGAVMIPPASSAAYRLRASSAGTNSAPREGERAAVRHSQRSMNEPLRHEAAQRPRRPDALPPLAQLHRIVGSSRAPATEGISQSERKRRETQTPTISTHTTHRQERARGTARQPRRYGTATIAAHKNCCTT